MNVSRTQYGQVALLGKTNVGKSTLFNQLIGRKISITTPKANTTRDIILSTSESEAVYILYMDTPGLRLTQSYHTNNFFVHRLNRTITNILHYADIVILIVEAMYWTREDEQILKQLADFPGNLLLAVNKIDKVVDKSRLLPFIAKISNKRTFTEIIPIAGLTGDNILAIKKSIVRLLPANRKQIDLNTTEDQFLAAEIIRENLMLSLRCELPYIVTVEIEQFSKNTQSGILYIRAIIWVTRASQKKIVVGKNGILLREVGLHSRKALEKLFNIRIFLDTWVRVRLQYEQN